MFRHGPSCLKGPLTRARNWWIPSAKDGAQVNPIPRATEMTHPDYEPRLPDAPIRTDLVERVRREIADGTYETPEKWAAALNRLLEHLEEA
jgi:hypothetical protein